MIFSLAGVALLLPTLISSLDDGKKDRKTERHKDRKTDRPKNRKTELHKNRRQKDREA